MATHIITNIVIKFMWDHGYTLITNIVIKFMWDHGYTHYHKHSHQVHVGAWLLLLLTISGSFSEMHVSFRLIKQFVTEECVGRRRDCVTFIN